jgi:restriction endonuclease S subunit
MNKAFTLSTSLNPKKVFILNKKELDKRLDPAYYTELRNNKFVFAYPSKSISRIVKTYSGGTPNKSIPEYWDGDICWASPKDMKDFYLIDTQDKITNEGVKNSATIVAPVGSVLIVFRSGILQHTLPVSITRIETSINQDLKVLVPSNEILPEYLAAFLKTFEKRILPRIVKSSTTVQSINQEEFNQLQVPVPAIEIQKKIISIFKSGIDQKKQNEAESERLLASIDDYLLEELGIVLPQPFGNALKNRMFTITFNELTGIRFDPFFHQIYFHKLLIELQNSKYSKSTLGENISEISYGASFNNTYVESGVPLLRIKDLKRNEISVDEIVYLPEDARDKIGNCFVTTNDFLITRSGTIGVVAIVPKSIDGFAFGSFMIKFTLHKTSQLDNEYLSYYLNSSILIKIIERNKIGAVQGNITIPTIKSLPIVIPPLTKQKEIANHITAIRLQAQQLKDKTKDALANASQEIEKILLG